MDNDVIKKLALNIMQSVREHGNVLVKGLPWMKSLYTAAMQSGSVLLGLPMDRETMAESPNINMTLEQFNAALVIQAQKEYPHVGEGDASVEMYFNMTHGCPALFFDPDTRENLNALLVQPVKNHDFFLLYMVAVDHLGSVIYHEAMSNEEYLARFRMDPKLVTEGVTYDLALARRQQIEGCLDGFHRVTGIKVKDKLRDSFRAIYKPEFDNMDTLKDRSAIPTLMEAFFVAVKYCASTQKVPTVYNTKAIADKVHDEYCGSLRMLRN
jgi:hypothetical protein